MRQMLLTIEPGPSPVYLRLADAMRKAIASGRVAAGAKLPSARMLAQQLGVHKHTVMSAMDELVAEGWVEAYPRSGYRVHPNLPKRIATQIQQQTSEASAPQVFAGAHEWTDKVFHGLDYYLSMDSGLRYRLMSSHGPDLTMLPLHEFWDALRRATHYPAEDTLGYSAVAGLPVLRAALESYLGYTRAVHGRKIIVTNGTTESIMLVALCLLGPGKRVLMDELCLPLVRAQFALTRSEITALPMDADGTNPEALELALREHGADLIYLTPLHQYPTTLTMSLQRRQEIYRIAASHGVPILEDDYDHEFHYTGDPPAPMASSDPHGIVIYASSLSKSVFPGVRMGCLAVPEALLAPLCKVRRCVTWQSNGILQQALAIWINEGGFGRHIERLRHVYMKRLANTMRLIDEAQRSVSPELSCCTPCGGSAVWLDTGRDADAVAQQAARLGVGICGESFFRTVADADTRRRHLRIAFTKMPEGEMEAALNLLWQAVAATPPLGPS